MTIKVDISDEAEAKLRDVASRNGVQPAAYASSLLEEALLRPRLTEALGPTGDRFEQTGMTDEQLGELLEAQKHSARAERRSNPG